MRDWMSLRKEISIGIMSIALLVSSVSISLAAEGDSGGGHAGMNMGGSTHEATPDMDPNMPGHGEVGKEAEKSSGAHGEASTQAEPSSGHETVSGGEHGAASSEGHGEASGGHGESSGTSEGVNWMVVGGFLAINALVIITAAILKASNKPQPQV